MAFAMGLSPAPLATFPEAPVFIPHSRISRVTVGDLGLSPLGLPTSAEAQALVRTHPWHTSFTQWLDTYLTLTRIFGVYAPAGCQVRARQVPRVPLPLRGVTSPGVTSGITSEGITPPSSLIRTHAPDHSPLQGLVFPIPSSLCRLLPAPAGSWPFPTLSLQSLHGRFGPLPRDASVLHLLVSSHRAAASPKRSGVRHIESPLEPLHQGAVFRGCSHSLMFGLPCSLDPRTAPTVSSASLFFAPTERQGCARGPGDGSGVPPKHRFHWKKGSWAVYTTLNSVGCLPRAVASLHV